MRQSWELCLNKNHGEFVRLKTISPMVGRFGVWSATLFSSRLLSCGQRVLFGKSWMNNLLGNFNHSNTASTREKLPMELNMELYLYKHVHIQR